MGQGSRQKRSAIFLGVEGEQQLFQRAADFAPVVAFGLKAKTLHKIHCDLNANLADAVAGPPPENMVRPTAVEVVGIDPHLTALPNVGERVVFIDVRQKEIINSLVMRGGLSASISLRRLVQIRYSTSGFQRKTSMVSMYPEFVARSHFRLVIFLLRRLLSLLHRLRPLPGALPLA